MTNPVAVKRTINFTPKNEDGSYGESIPAYDDILVYCQGCDMMHRFTIAVYNGFERRPGEPPPVWGFDGNMESPTFTPSLLCYYTVHFCEGEHIYTECNLSFEECGHSGHGYAWVFEDGHMRTFKVYEEKPDDVVKTITFGGPSPHPRAPAFGNCHSFLVNGVWNFLDDCAHSLRGNHPLLPIPEYMWHYG